VPGGSNGLRRAQNTMGARAPAPLLTAPMFVFTVQLYYYLAYFLIVVAIYS